MLVGVIADTHDNLPKIESATNLFARKGVEVILHAGDFVAPFALKALLKPAIPLIGVFGNNDGERRGLKKLCRDIHQSPYRFELGGKVVVLAHDGGTLQEGDTQGADMIVCGHTHEPGVERAAALIVNPGEAGGWLTGRCTVAAVDLTGMQAEIIELGSQETVQV